MIRLVCKRATWHQSYHTAYSRLCYLCYLLGALHPIFSEVVLSLKGYFTAVGSRPDGLLVEWIRHILSCEYARELGAWRSPFGEDVAYVVDELIIEEALMD